jgi:Concanavalin A-like lectin/glucanases superfamily
MPTSQILLGLGQGSGPPPPPPPAGQYQYNNGFFTYGYSNGNGDPVLQNIVLPGGQTEDSLLFSGTGWQMTNHHTIVGNFFIDFWFYPTANNCILLTEHGDSGLGVENTGYHCSILEITSANQIKARTWPMNSGQAVTSPNTVTLNGWNHINFYYYNGTVSLTLNGGTAAQTSGITRQTPALFDCFGFGTTTVSNMGTSTRYTGRINKFRYTTYISNTTFDDTKGKYIPPLSLVFNQPEQDNLYTPASADWNLGTTWTIEFWLKANHASNAGINIPGGQWGLLNQHGWYYGIDSNSILIGLTAGNLTIAQTNTSDVQYAEPQAGVWTHVAIVNDAGTQKVYYNGIEQTKVSGSFGGNGWTNVTDNLYIGRLAPPYASHFDGKMALIRISNTVKYAAAFAATTTYNVEADTVLFLGLTYPLFDAKAHTITNSGVTISLDVPT